MVICHCIFPVPAIQACVSDDAFSDGGDTGPISHSSTSCMSADESDSCLHGNMNVIAGDASCRVNDDSSDVVEECGGTFPPVSPGTGGDSTGEVADGELASGVSGFGVDVLAALIVLVSSCLIVSSEQEDLHGDC